MSKKQDNINQIINGLDNEGFSKLEIAGILGGLRGETKDFDPTTRQTYYKTDKKTGKKVKKQGKGFGIAQWELGYDKKGKPRRGELLKAFAKKNNFNHKDLDTQIKFLIHEIRGSESRNWDKIKKGKSAGEIAQLFTRYFERPATSLWKKGKKNEGNLDRTTTPITEEEKKRGKYADSFMKDVNSHKFKNNLNKQAKPYLGDDVPVNEDKKQLMKETLAEMKMGYKPEEYEGGAEELPWLKKPEPEYLGGAELVPPQFKGGSESLPEIAARRLALKQMIKPAVEADIQQEVTPTEAPMVRPEASREAPMSRPNEFQDDIQSRIDADKARMRTEALRGMKHGGIVYAQDSNTMSVLDGQQEEKPKPIFGGAQQVGGGQLKTTAAGTSSSGVPKIGGSGIAQNATASGEPGPSDKKGSGSFTNISKYIDANKPATQKMSEKIVGKVTEKTQDLSSDVQDKTQAKLNEAARIRSDLTTGQDDFYEKIDEAGSAPTQTDTTSPQVLTPEEKQAEIDRNNAAVAAGMPVTTTPEPTTNTGIQQSEEQKQIAEKKEADRIIKLREGTTAGPEAADLSKESLRMDALNRIGEGIGTSGGRAGLLKDSLNKAGYTKGQANLDSYLFGRDPSVRGENITAIQDKVKAVRDRMVNSKEMLAPIPKEIMDKVLSVSKNIKEKLTGARGEITEKATTDMTDYNEGRRQLQEFMAGDREGIDKKYAEILGLTEGQKLWEDDSFGQKVGGPSGASEFVDQAGFDRLSALAKLSGKDEDFATQEASRDYKSIQDRVAGITSSLDSPQDYKNAIQNIDTQINGIAGRKGFYATFLNPTQNRQNRSEGKAALARERRDIFDKASALAGPWPGSRAKPYQKDHWNKMVLAHAQGIFDQEIAGVEATKQGVTDKAQTALKFI